MTYMCEEIRQTAEVVRNLINIPEIMHYGAMLKKNPPKGIVTIARGTSDHAAEYLAYWLMQRKGIPVASLPMSLNTLYETSWELDDWLALSISQSGGSQDLVESVKRVRAGNANTLAIVNTVPSLLADASAYTINIQAGLERSVAATKSFIASIVAGLHVFNSWLEEKTLTQALTQLPERLEKAQALDWSRAVSVLQSIDRLYVVGRGYGLPIAKEAALKCKETCLLQGEAFSGAEVRHGPMALMNVRQVVLVLAPPGRAQEGLCKLALSCREMGATVLLAADDKVIERDLPLIDAGHEVLQGLTTIQTFYAMAEQLSGARGIDTDNPPNLNKVTITR